MCDALQGLRRLVVPTECKVPPRAHGPACGKARWLHLRNEDKRIHGPSAKQHWSAEGVSPAPGPGRLTIGHWRPWLSWCNLIPRPGKEASFQNPSPRPTQSTDCKQLHVLKNPPCKHILTGHTYKEAPPTLGGSLYRSPAETGFLIATSARAILVLRNWWGGKEA